MSLSYHCIKTLTPTSSPTVFQVKDGRLIGIVLSLGKGNESKLFEFFFQIVQNCPLLTSKIDIIIRVDSKLASATSYVIFAKSVNSLHTTLIIFFLTVYFHVSICSGNIQKEHDRAHPLYVQIKFLS